MLLTLRTSFLEYAREVFTIDARSLAVARIGTGLVLLWDLFSYLDHGQKYFLSTGIIPIQGWIAYIAGTPTWTIHRAESEWWLLALLSVHIVAASFVIIGYRTRICTLVALVLCVSLHNAVAAILTGGDVVVRSLLLFGLFLSWGEVHSVDAARAGYVTRKDSYFSPWSIAAIMQIVSIYVFARLHKIGQEWVNGTAIWYATGSLRFATPFGKWLHQHAYFTEILTYFVLYAQKIGPVLLFSPYKNWLFRLCFLVVFTILHVGYMLSLYIEWFSIIMLVALSLLIPAIVWKWISGFFYWSDFGGLTLYYDGDCGFCRTSVFLAVGLCFLPRSVCLPAQNVPDVFALMEKYNSWVVTDRRNVNYTRYEAFLVVLRASPILYWLPPILTLCISPVRGDSLYGFVAKNRSRACVLIENDRKMPRIATLTSTILACMVILTVLVWNFENVTHYNVSTRTATHTAGLSIPVYALGLSQKWDLFAPGPTQFQRWLIVRLTWSEGTQTDALRDNKPVSFRVPMNGREIFRDLRLAAYLDALLMDEFSTYRTAFAAYYCHQKNKERTYPQEVEVIMGSKRIDEPASFPQFKSLQKMHCASYLIGQ